MFDFSPQLMRVIEKVLQSFILERLKDCKQEDLWKQELATHIEKQYPRYPSQYEKIHLLLQKKSYEEIQLEWFDITLLSTLLEFWDYFVKLYSLDSKQHKNRVCNHIRILREARNALEHDAKTPEVLHSRDHYFEQLNAIHSICGFCSLILNYFSDDDYWKNTIKDMKRLENSLLGEKWVINLNEQNCCSSENLSDLLELADGGNAVAQLAVGKIYYEGERVNSDYEKAYMWFKKASRKKNAEALYFLGKCYGQGIGVDYDFKKEREYFLKSADLGCAEACAELANLYMFDSPPNWEESFKWAKKASDKKNPAGMWLLAIHYSQGKAVQRNLEVQSELIHKSAELGYRPACEHLANEARRNHDIDEEIKWNNIQLQYASNKSDKRSLKMRIDRLNRKKGIKESDTR